MYTSKSCITIQFKIKFTSIKLRSIKQKLKMYVGGVNNNRAAHIFERTISCLTKSTKIC